MEAKTLQKLWEVIVKKLNKSGIFLAMQKNKEQDSQ